MGSTGREPEVTRADFPDGFVFGVATSAYQVPPDRRRPHLIPRGRGRGRFRLASRPAACLRLAYD